MLRARGSRTFACWFWGIPHFCCIRPRAQHRPGTPRTGHGSEVKEPPVPPPSPKTKKHTATNPQTDVIGWAPGTNGTANAVAGGVACRSASQSPPFLYAKTGHIEDPPACPSLRMHKIQQKRPRHRRRDIRKLRRSGRHCIVPDVRARWEYARLLLGCRMPGGWEGSILIIDRRGLGRSLPSPSTTKPVASQAFSI